MRQCDEFFERGLRPRWVSVRPPEQGGNINDLNLFNILADRLLRQYSLQRYTDENGRVKNLGILWDGDRVGMLGRLRNAARYRAFLNCKSARSKVYCEANAFHYRYV